MIEKTVEHITAGCYLLRGIGDDREVLLIYNKWSEDDKGWVLPKGHIEEGETLEQTAIRETTEETGYQNIKIIAPLKTLHIQYPGEHGVINKKAIHWFLAELIDNKKLKRKLTECELKREIKQKWVNFETAITMLKFDDEREILRSIV